VARGPGSSAGSTAKSTVHARTGLHVRDALLLAAAGGLLLGVRAPYDRGFAGAHSPWSLSRGCSCFPEGGAHKSDTPRVSQASTSGSTLRPQPQPREKAAAPRLRPGDRSRGAHAALPGILGAEHRVAVFAAAVAKEAAAHDARVRHHVAGRRGLVRCAAGEQCWSGSDPILNSVTIWCFFCFRGDSSADCSW
jgi:hypothetical protein